MQIALALYPNFTMLDIIGPFQVLADVPGHDVVFVAAQGRSGRRPHRPGDAHRDKVVRRRHRSPTSSSCPAGSTTPSSSRS